MRGKFALSGLITIIILLYYALPAVSGNPSETIKGQDGTEMALVPAGKFYMGSKGEDYPDDEKPRHEVYLNSFYIDRHEVNNGMFAKFLNAVRPDEGKGKQRWQWVVIRNDMDEKEREGWFPTEIIYKKGGYVPLKGFEKYPVISLSWHVANQYCRWAEKRLPTEAEWEKAARGEIIDKDFPWGNQMPTQESGVIFGRRWANNRLPAPTNKTGNYPNNGYGIYDMAGNVAEWCSDWYSPDYYKKSPDKNPKGPPEGSMKVLRGGSWASSAVGIRVAVRASNVPDSKLSTVGFRCVYELRVTSYELRVKKRRR